MHVLSHWGIIATKIQGLKSYLGSRSIFHTISHYLAKSRSAAEKQFWLSHSSREHDRWGRHGWLDGEADLEFLWSFWCRSCWECRHVSFSPQQMVQGEILPFAWKLPNFCFDVSAKRIMLHWSGFSPAVPVMSGWCWAEQLSKQAATSSSDLFQCHEWLVCCFSL